MRSRLYDDLRNTPVYRRLWISSVTVAIIPTVMISVLLLTVFWNTFTDRASEYAANLTLQTAGYIELQAQQVNNEIANFSRSESTRGFLKRYAYMNRSERYRALEKVRVDIAYQFSRLPVISNIALVTYDQRHYINAYECEPAANGDKWNQYAAILDVFERPDASTVYHALYNEPGGGGLVIAKCIVENDTGAIAGYILVQMDEHFLSDVYAGRDLSRSGEVYILDGDGRVLSTDASGADSFPEPVISEMRDSRGVLSDVRLREGGERYIMAYAKVRTPGLWAVNLVPRNYLSDDMLSITLAVVLVALVLTLLSSGAAWIIMNSITEPISGLIARMEQVQNDRLEAGEPDPHRDELATVNNAFNQTVRRLQDSIAEIRRAEEEKVALEIDMLTAQISPHFLTNTLNTVLNLARIQNVGNVESMVGSLINILAARLGRHDTLVPLRDEIALLEDYMNLQKYRYFNDIAFEVRVDPDVSACLIPVFTLQPLVENALRHGGLDARMDGRIQVKAYRAGEKVHLLVIDNGVGMSPERLKAVRSLQEQPLAGSDGRAHIGVRNVHQRLKLIFGGGFGLTLSSREGVFTEAEILLPDTCARTEEGDQHD